MGSDPDRSRASLRVASRGTARAAPRRAGAKVHRRAVGQPSPSTRDESPESPVTGAATPSVGTAPSHRTGQVGGRRALGSPRRRVTRAGGRPAAMTTGLATLGFLGAFALFALDVGNTRSTAAGFLVLPLLMAAAAPLIRSTARLIDWPEASGLLWLSLAGHAVGAVFRTRSAADSLEYHRVGVELAEQFRTFDFAANLDRPVPGTGVMQYLTGLVGVITGTDFFATLLIFTFGAYLGTVLLLRAFVLAVPDGAHRRYAVLVLLWPSLVFWPSSIGKESWMILTTGLAALGAARWYVHRRGGMTMVALGLFGAFMVRPHVALILLAAVGIAFVLRSNTSGSATRTFGKVAGVLLLIAAGSLLAGRTAEFLGVESLSGEGVESALDRTEEQTAQGGTEFSPARVRTPLDFPWATVTVLFRPFLSETSSAETVFTALEATTLAALSLLSWRRLLRVPAVSFRRPYVGLAGAYTAMFIFGFSTIGNFGILARQRAQILPFYFVLLAAPLVLSAADRPSRAPADAPAGTPATEGRARAPRAAPRPSRRGLPRQAAADGPPRWRRNLVLPTAATDAPGTPHPPPPARPS